MRGGAKGVIRSSRSLHFAFSLHTESKKREWRCKEGDLILSRLVPSFYEVLMSRRILLVVQGCALNNYLYKHRSTQLATYNNNKKKQKRKTRFSNSVPNPNSNEHFSYHAQIIKLKPNYGTINRNRHQLN